MNFLISGIIAILFVVVCRNFIKKHSTICYIIASILSILLVIGTYTGLVYNLPTWFTDSIYPIFIKSSFSTALFVIVMYTGAFKNGSPLIKFLMPIRAELSIIASILTLAHNISFGKDHFVRLFTAPQTMEPNMIIAAIISIILIIIMIPLMITSFPSVRKKMEPKKWKSLQKTAYLFYALIYVHVMFIMIPFAKLGMIDYKVNILIYTLVFLTYGAMRINKECVKKGVSKSKSLAPVVIASISFILINGYAFYSPADTVIDTNSIVEETTEDEIASEDSNKEDISNNIENDIKVEEEVQDEDTSDSLVVENETNASTSSNNKDNSSTQATENNKNNNGSSSSSNNSNNTSTNSNSNNNNNTSSDKENNKTEPEVIEPDNSIYNDGVYTGSASGYNGPITVKVTIKNDSIVNVQVTDTTDNEPFISNAISGILNKILSSQSSNVDTVSGATYSSKGIINAVNNALAQAKR